MVQASQRRHARSANITIQAKRSVVKRQAASHRVAKGVRDGRHLGEMRLSVLKEVLLLELNAVL